MGLSQQGWSSTSGFAHRLLTSVVSDPGSEFFLGFRASSLGLRVEDLGFRDWGLGFRAEICWKP